MGTDKGWLDKNLEDAEFRRLFERELVADDFIAAIEAAMEASDLNRTQLAERMGCSLANVTRALRSTTNMTLSTMVDMALALGQRVKIAIEPFVTKTENSRPYIEDVPENQESESAEAGAPASMALLLWGAPLKRERRIVQQYFQVQHV